MAYGQPEDAPIELMTEEQWRNTMAVNLDSVFGLVQAAVMQMELQGPPAKGDDGSERAYCADQLDGGAAGRGHARGLCRDERRADQSDKEPVDGAGAAGDYGELRGSGVGGDGYVGGNAGRSGSGRADSGWEFRWGAWPRRRRLRGRCCFCVRRWRGLFPAKW